MNTDLRSDRPGGRARSRRPAQLPAAAMAAALLAAGAAVLAASSPANAIGIPNDAFLYRLGAVTSTAAVPVQNFTDRITYTTAGGFSRTVSIAVRTPPGAAETELPVVIIAHGGGEQPNARNPATTLPEWGEALARAGYLTINVLHGTNVGTDRTALCNAIGYPVTPDPAALSATLQDLAAALVQASQSAGGVAIAVDELIDAHPGLFDHLADMGEEHDEESPLVEQVMDILLARLQGCRSINGLGLWDRPYDIAAVVDALHDGVITELDGWIDTDRIALLGHSNGTSSVLNAVGLQRALPNGVKVPAPFPAGHERRPLAAVALSPMGVNTYGLFDTAAWAPGVTDSKEHSWMGLNDIAVMTLTGDGDNHCKTRYVCSDSDSGAKRMIPFHRMPGGNKYSVYLHDRLAEEIVSSHELFGSLDAPGVCRSPSLAGLCADEVKWLKSAVIAFLDAHVLSEQSAVNWLRSKNLSRASGRLARMKRK
ncbi:MAG TPA: hypothetical protein VEC57_15755 [Candidatus Limnocylindrales bacterium]|nr:hypothetical protein [Candidatus Limnocylindrales bacterium]